MTPVPGPKQAHKLRPFLPADAMALRAIFVQAVDELAAEDYDEAQRAAWIETAEDGAAFAGRLADMLTLIVVENGAPIGFASLKDKRVIEMLYVHPLRARQGVATTLVDAMEKLAAAAGTAKISVEASDTALPLFDARGYQPERRQSLAMGDTWISNTVMSKALGTGPAKV